MRRTSRLLLAALTATVVMGTLVGTSQARTLRSSSNLFRVTWTSLEFAEAFFGISVRCPVTLEGTFHSTTIAKVVGSLIGYVTRAAVANTACTGGHATVLTATLPWHVTYEGFTGTLPNITRIRLLMRRPSFQIENSIIGTCLSSPENLNGELSGTTAGGVFTVTTLNPGTETIPCRNTRGETVIIGVFRGSGNVTVLGAATRVSVTLI
jgi:hypothetical protein